MKTPGVRSAGADQNPFWLANQVYCSEPCARPFSKDLDAHLIHGYVFNTPQLFLMGRPVCRFYPGVHIVDPTYTEFHETDSWFIYCAAGDLRQFFKFVPYPLPYVGWERDNKVRFYPYNKVMERIIRENTVEID